MSRSRVLVYLLLCLVAVLAFCQVAYAGPQYVQQIPAQVENKSCSLCHTSNYPELNADGKAWVAAGKDWNVFLKKAAPAPAEKPGTAATGGEAKKELPKTGGSVTLLVAPGMAAILAGLILAKRGYRN